MKYRARLTLVPLVFLIGCQAAAGSGNPLPHAPWMLSITMANGRFENPTTAQAGPTVIEIRNRDRVDHKVDMVRIPDEFPGTLDAQLHSSTRRPMSTVASLPVVAPGGRQVLAVDLRPGRYGFISFVKDPDGVSQSLKGMVSEMKVP